MIPKCPRCRKDLKDELTADVEYYGPKTYHAIECDQCGKEITFEVKWAYTLVEAVIV